MKKINVTYDITYETELVHRHSFRCPHCGLVNTVVVRGANVMGHVIVWECMDCKEELRLSEDFETRNL